MTRDEWNRRVELFGLAMAQFFGSIGVLVLLLTDRRVFAWWWLGGCAAMAIYRGARVALPYLRSAKP